MWISAERLGVPAGVAARVMEARADAKSADGRVSRAEASPARRARRRRPPGRRRDRRRRPSIDVRDAT